MLIALDFVWIGADCRVAEVTGNVPPPDRSTSERDLPRYRPGVPVRYVLEINADETKALGIQSGTEVRFSGLKLDEVCSG